MHYPPVRQMIREAVEELGSPTTNVVVRDWIIGRYPGTNARTIDAQRIVCTVNQPSRVHHPEGLKPRECDDPRYDFLYCPSRGELEWYRAVKHGVWSIEEDENGGFAVCCDDGELVYPGQEERAVTQREPASKQAKAAIPITQAQVDAANRLHDRCPQWSVRFERGAAGQALPHQPDESVLTESVVRWFGG